MLAHPLTVNDYEALIAELTASGLVGIEAYYGEFTTEETNRLVKLAEKHGLIATGGSDYHGLDDNAEVMVGAANVPMESAKKLISLAEMIYFDTPTGELVFTVLAGFAKLENEMRAEQSRDTKITIAKASPSQYSVIASRKILSSTHWTPPSFANGRLYIRNARGDIVCVDLRS